MFNLCTERALGGFKDQVARRLTERLPLQKPERKWTYNLSSTEREEAGFLTMEEYIRRRQNTVAQYIDTQ